MEVAHRGGNLQTGWPRSFTSLLCCTVLRAPAILAPSHPATAACLMGGLQNGSHVERPTPAAAPEAPPACMQRQTNSLKSHDQAEWLVTQASKSLMQAARLWARAWAHHSCASLRVPSHSCCTIHTRCRTSAACPASSTAAPSGALAGREESCCSSGDAAANGDVRKTY